ncbi:pyridoxal phosphate-dependent aminotransferase [Micromonospora echinofusca]|uniref:Aminotransferase n=1 Tax=Micromonospora echinofusca TaxID=47858 RepID=A0ABS3VNJ2_MICEH|nr:pyridoxal phosphate-dependent aminotransferase [Micromonospora echinofusca]MBO4206023.1 aminotransferase class I/II-fold pyridoxal phosphate-dependent enzyme [Micromonospora echinofusca]
MTSTMAARATHAQSIPPSCVHDVYRSVNAWAARTGRPVARLDVGEPHFTPPLAVIEALAAAVRDGRTGYTPAEGLPVLRERLAAKLVEHNGHDTVAERVLVTPGASQGLSALMQSVTDPGDEILLPALHWPIHLQQSLLAGLRPRFYPLDDEYRPDLDALATMGNERTRVLLTNTPSNPTGCVYDADLQAALLELARRNDWLVIADEAYEDFVYSGRHVSMAALERDVPPAERRVFSVYSYSKSFAMTGYRLGYVATPNAAHAATLQVVQEASILSSPTPVQYAGLAALDAMSEVADNRERLRSARDALAPLAELGLIPRVPAGGWFALVDIDGLGTTADAFAAALLERDAVAVAPARGFALRPVITAGRVARVDADPASEHLVRIAFCGEPTQVSEAARRIAAFAAELAS